MQNHNNGDLTAKETADLLREWRYYYSTAVNNISAAVVRLEEVKNELNNEKKKYQKSFWPILNENFRALLFFFSVVVLLIGAAYIPSSFKVELGSLKIEKSQTCPPLKERI
jgi:hypothetical protein